MYDVAIIGAGVVGAMIARSLSRYDLKICIIEKGHDVATGATKANSGIVHAGYDAQPGTLKAKLNVEGAAMMEQVAAELGVSYKRNGSLVVGFNDEDRKMIETLLARGIKNGVKELRILNGDELHALEPNISEAAVCALYAPSGAIICPYGLTIAAVGNAMDNGAELMLDCAVTSVNIKEGYFEIFFSGGCLCSKAVINAAGLFSDEIARMVGDSSFNIHPRKGEYILYDKECGGIVTHTVFGTPSKLGKGILVLTTVDGNLMTGPTSVDVSDKTDTATTVNGLSKIISDTKYKLATAVQNKAITSFCGVRAVGDTGDFIINSPIKNFINVAGIESPGLSASPAIADYVVNMLRQSIELIEKPDYNPMRQSMTFFRDMSAQEKNALIEKDSSFGKIVCRCENVTEGEVLYALRANPKARDLDGIKRRTRAQMGRCQGGFCTPKLVSLLATELGIDYEAVTKFGGGSYLSVGRVKGEA